jgi:flagellar hook-length control protein FliK
VARAAQVDLAVRVENATGQPVPADQAPQPLATGLAGRGGFGNLGNHGGGAGQAALGDAGGMFGRATSADDPAFGPQIVRGLNAMLNQRGGAMIMRLDPPELGQLRVHMSIVSGVVSVEFSAGSAQAQMLLDQHLPALRHSLESQGLSVERLTVHAANGQTQQGAMTARDGSGSNDQQQQSSSWSNQHDAAGSESRGRREQEARTAWSWADEAFSLESLLGTDAGLGSQVDPTLVRARSGAERRNAATVRRTGGSRR